MNNALHRYYTPNFINKATFLVRGNPVHSEKEYSLWHRGPQLINPEFEFLAYETEIKKSVVERFIPHAWR